MTQYTFSPDLAETRRVSLVLSLRKAGFYSYLDGYSLYTVASSLAVNLVFGTSHWRALPLPSNSLSRL